MVKVDRTGETFITKDKCEGTIISYNGAFDCTVQFKCKTILEKVNYSQIKSGQLKNPNCPSVFGVGYKGIGIYEINENKKPTKSGSTWSNMFRRCYNTEYQSTKPTYKGCSVDERWHNFQSFAQWFQENYTEGFELDKDILVKGNKTYSPDTCCFVPSEINILFTKRQNNRGEYPIGVIIKNGMYIARINIGKTRKYLGTYPTPEEAFQAYKIAKEEEIKRVADEWRDRIDPQVYQAMYNYKVEIDD